MDKRRYSLRTKTTFLTLFLLTSTILFHENERTAHAGFFNDIYDNFQQFTELPDEIDELKNSYQKALEDLERARIDTEMYQKQNAELAEQNRQLTSMLEQMKVDEAEKARKSERIKTVIVTAIALLAGYFLLTRILRFGMRRRTNRF
ncbi:hypothetical protein [Paenibacillus sp. GCM10028914]|uniref:hypothetical protein n=1 Tax=Paenibacillus sp. GCM10028914 TaxID=3273416 RepID=UPI00360C4010